MNEEKSLENSQCDQRPAGLTATMEIAGVESIEGVKTDKTILGFSDEE